MEFALTYLSCPERQLTEYLLLINKSVPDELSLTTLANSDRFAKLKDLVLSSNNCASGASFSQRGLIIRPHRARMTDQLSG